MDEDEAFNKKKMLLLDIKEGLKDPWLNLQETDLETQVAPSAAHEVEKAEEVEIWENDIKWLYGANELAQSLSKLRLKKPKKERRKTSTS